MDNAPYKDQYGRRYATQITPSSEPGPSSAISSTAAHTSGRHSSQYHSKLQDHIDSQSHRVHRSPYARSSPIIAPTGPTRGDESTSTHRPPDDHGHDIDGPSAGGSTLPPQEPDLADLPDPLQDGGRPPVTVNEMIRATLRDRQLRSRQICDAIRNRYSYYAEAKRFKHLQNTVRHHLSKTPGFVRSPKLPGMKGKGDLWALGSAPSTSQSGPSASTTPSNLSSNPPSRSSRGLAASSTAPHLHDEALPMVDGIPVIQVTYPPAPALPEASSNGPAPILLPQASLRAFASSSLAPPTPLPTPVFRQPAAQTPNDPQDTSHALPGPFGSPHYFNAVQTLAASGHGNDEGALPWSQHIPQTASELMNPSPSDELAPLLLDELLWYPTEEDPYNGYYNPNSYQ